MPCRSFDFPVWLETESFWKLDLEKWEMDLATGLVLPTDRNLGRPWIPSNCHSIFLPRLKFKVLIFCFNIGGQIQTPYQLLSAEVQKNLSSFRFFVLFWDLYGRGKQFFYPWMAFTWTGLNIYIKFNNKMDWVIKIRINGHTNINVNINNNANINIKFNISNTSTPICFFQSYSRNSRFQPSQGSGWRNHLSAPCYWELQTYQLSACACNSFEENTWQLKTSVNIDLFNSW